MSSKWSYIMGTVTIVAIVGGTIYAIKKSKDIKKLEEEEITVEEAMAEVRARRESGMDKATEEFAEMVEDLRAEADYNKGFVKNEDTSEYIKRDIETTTEFYEKLRNAKLVTGSINDVGVLEDEDVFDDARDLIDDEDDDAVRHEPNSKDAREQYIKMELAEWRPLEDSYQTLHNLFEFIFEPQNDGDHELLTRVIDHRVQYFGFESKWVKEVTFADIVLYYSRQAEFNCGESVKYWVEYFLGFNELDHTYSDQELDHMTYQLNSHTYFNESTQTYGLFGLTQGYMEQAIKIANMNIDKHVTYDIEFNEFLKSCL